MIAVILKHVCVHQQNMFYTNGKHRYNFCLVQAESYSLKQHTDSGTRYTEDIIIKLIGVLINNIFVGFLFQQSNEFKKKHFVDMQYEKHYVINFNILFIYYLDFTHEVVTTGIL